jgi:hypothetical protein
MLELKHVYQTFTLDTGTKLKALSDVNLTVKPTSPKILRSSKKLSNTTSAVS